MPIFDPEQLAKWSSGEWNKIPENPIAGFSIDSRSINTGEIFVAIRGDRDGHDFIKSAASHGANGGIVDRLQTDVSIPQLLVEDTLQAFHDIAHNHRLSFDGPVVGVTGSCGKTSTKDTLGLLLGKENTHTTSGNLNNHLGVPLTLLKCDNGVHQFSVVEAGINQVGEMSNLAQTIAPNMVVVTMVAHSHLEGLGSIETIASEKADLFNISDITETVIFPENCLKYEKFRNRFNSGNGTIVLREGEPRVDPKPDEAFYSIWTETNKIGDSSSLRLWRHGSPSFSVTIPAMSKGMGGNAALAVLAAQELGVSVQEISERLPRFRPSALRGICYQGRGRSYFVDCYNANPASMIDSLEFFIQQFIEKKKLFVLAGMEELGPDEKELHYNVGAKIKAEETDLIILVGKKASWMSGALLESGCREEQIIVLDNMEDAIPIVDDFDGAVLFKGSRAYKLEKLLPSWATEVKEVGITKEC